MTPAEHIAESLADEFYAKRMELAEFVVSHLRTEGWEIRRKFDMPPPPPNKGRPLGRRQAVQWRDITYVGANDWPPPQPGTHESDLPSVMRPAWADWEWGVTDDITERVECVTWSQQNNTKRWGA